MKKLVCLSVWLVTGAGALGGQAATQKTQVPQEAQEAQEAKKARKAWDDLFAQEDPAAAPAKIDAVLSACGNDAGKLRALIAADTSYPPMKPAWHRRKTSVQDGEQTHEVEFVVRVPAGYTPTKSWPLLLVAHGQGNTGEHILAAFDRVLGEAIDKFVVVAPTMPGPEGFNAQPYQEQAYLKPLTWARVHLNVDDDRVYISGYSQGGHLVWHMAVLFPQEFAAALPMAGAPIFEGSPATTVSYMQNLANLPTWAIWGEKDNPDPPKMGNADFCRAASRRLAALKIKTYKATELKGRGHDGCWPSGREMAEFLLAHKRDPMPRQDWHYFHLDNHRRSYYVEALKLAHTPIDFAQGARITLPPGMPATQENIARAYEKAVQAVIYRVYASLDTAHNVLRVQPMGINAVRLYVLDGMFDLSKPVHLSYFSRFWRGQVPVSARCMLTHYATTRDAAALVCNEIDLHSAGGAVVRFK